MRGEEGQHSSSPSFWPVLNQSSYPWASTHFCKNPIAVLFRPFLSPLVTLFFLPFWFLVTVLLEPKGTRMGTESVGRSLCWWSFFDTERLTSFLCISFTLSLVECIRQDYVSLPTLKFYIMLFYILLFSILFISYSFTASLWISFWKLKLQ